MLDRLTAAMTDVQDVHSIARNGEQNPIYVRQVAVEQVADFKGKERALRSHRAAFRKFGQGFDRVL